MEEVTDLLPAQCGCGQGDGRPGDLLADPLCRGSERRIGEQSLHGLADRGCIHLVGLEREARAGAGAGCGVEELVEMVQSEGVPSPKAPVRYKEPQHYYVNGDLDALPPEPPVSELWRLLCREPVESLGR